MPFTHTLYYTQLSPTHHHNSSTANIPRTLTVSARNLEPFGVFDALTLMSSLGEDDSRLTRLWFRMEGGVGYRNRLILIIIIITKSSRSVEGSELLCISTTFCYDLDT